MSTNTETLSSRGRTMSDQLARHARKIPDHHAVSFDDTRRTYRETDERVSRLANALGARASGPETASRCSASTPSK